MSKPYHLLMHITPPKCEEELWSAKIPSKEDTVVVLTHLSQLQNCCQVLLITCQVQIVGPDELTTQALLDSVINFVSYAASCATPPLSAS